MKTEPCPTGECETLCAWKRVECSREVTRRFFKCGECGKKFDVDEEPQGPEFFDPPGAPGKEMSDDGS